MIDNLTDQQLLMVMCACAVALVLVIKFVPNDLSFKKKRGGLDDYQQ